jgi:preprotein translocase subunit YajC
MNPIFDFFIAPAYAEVAGSASVQGAQGSGYSLIIMFLVFILFFYFAIWRPQNKRAKEQQNLLNSLAKGDEVLTAGGVLGRINKVSGQYVVLSIANNIDVLVQKSSVVSVMPKGTLKTIEQS